MAIKKFNAVKYTKSLSDARTNKAAGKSFINDLTAAAKQKDIDVVYDLPHYAKGLIGWFEDDVLPILSVFIDENVAREAGKTVEGILSLVSDSQLVEIDSEGRRIYGLRKMINHFLGIIDPKTGKVQKVSSLEAIYKWSITNYVKECYESKYAPAGMTEDEYKQMQSIHKDLASLADAVKEKKTAAVREYRRSVYKKTGEFLRKELIKAQLGQNKAEAALLNALADGDTSLITTAQGKVAKAQTAVKEVKARIKEHENRDIYGVVRNTALIYKEGAVDDSIETLEEVKEETAPDGAYEALKEEAKTSVTLEALLEDAAKLHMSARQCGTLKSMWVKAHK